MAGLARVCGVYKHNYVEYWQVFCYIELIALAGLDTFIALAGLDTFICLIFIFFRWFRI